MSISRDWYTPGASVPNDIDSREDMRSTWCCIEKGYTPPPFSIVQNPATGVVSVQFELNPFNTTCKCKISCTTSALVFNEDATEDEIGQFCPADAQFSVTLLGQIFSESAPTMFNFMFEDASGNQTTLRIHSLVKVIPIAPLVLLRTDLGGRVNEVSVPLYSSAFVDLRKVVDQYQIERYEGSPNNWSIFVDWTNTRGSGNKERTHWDRRVRTGVEYGYRTRFRSTFDDTSPWSAWLTLGV